MGLPAGDHSLSVEAVSTGTPGANEPAPRSDAPAALPVPILLPRTNTAADPNELKPMRRPNELKPSGAPDPNELTPAPDAQSRARGRSRFRRQSRSTRFSRVSAVGAPVRTASFRFQFQPGQR